MPRFNLGAFAGGLAGGYTLAQNLDLAQKKEQREQETHDLVTRIRKIGLGRLEKEEPLFDKELQLRGTKLDFDINEQGFKNQMQDFEQQTRRLLAENQRTQAGIQGQQLQAQQQRLPDELAVAREELNNKVLDAIRRQTANVWNVLKLGNKALALEMFNNSALLMPGEKAKDFSIEDVETTGPDGGTHARTKVLVIQPEKEDGKPIRVPVQQLDALAEQFGARYEKVGKSLVRISKDGKVTPIFSDDEFAATPEGDIYSRRTGLPPAAAGVNVPRLPGAGRKEQNHMDNRVKMAIDKVILPKYGGRFEGGMFFPDEKNKEVALRATQLVGEYVRQGMDPEAAGVKAVQEAEREKALKEVSGAPSGSGYTGPRPWKQ